MLVIATAGVMLVALLLYALLGGADFGGGIWDLLASGERKAAQRKAVSKALAPVWEANHVWLIFAVVVMFTAFPSGFARMGTELHVPLTLMLIGIVLRGSAFVFRQYGRDQDEQQWGTVFAVSSIVSPTLLGCSLGQMTTGLAWYSPLAILVGVLALAAFAFLAAVYLCVELDDTKQPDLRDDFRRRAQLAAGVLAVIGAVTAVVARIEAPRFAHALVASPWSIPVMGTAGAALVATVVMLRRGRDRWARAAAIATVTLVIGGWAGAHYPYLFAPDLTLAAAAAPAATLKALLPVVIAGTVILMPSLWWLLRVFKSS